MSYLTYPVATGESILNHHRNERQKRANALKQERQRIRDIVKECDVLSWTVKDYNAIARSNVDYKMGKSVPFRPTLANFRKAYRYMLNFSYSGWDNPLDTEYYSACGYDDYQYERRESARSEAVEYFRAWKTLKEEKACMFT